MQASLLANVGALQFVVHGTAEAEPFYKKALAIAENALDQEKPLFAHILLSYAVVLERTHYRGEITRFRQAASPPGRFGTATRQVLEGTAVRGRCSGDL